VGTGGTAARPAIMFRDRRAFWFETGAVIAGVVLHLPMFLPALAVGRFGIETRRRGLEEITAVELRKALEVR
jgi:hypothetical protein